jgi:primosomal protein N'
MDFKKMKRADLEHYLFIARQFSGRGLDEQGEKNLEAAEAEFERRNQRGSKGALTAAQQKVLDSIKTQHKGEISVDAANHTFNAGTLRNLVQKGVLTVESHSRLRQDDMEMVYWSTYRVTNKLEQTLK